MSKKSNTTRVLKSMKSSDLKLALAKQDFIILCQYACSGLETFSKICFGLINLYTVYFPPIFFKKTVKETLHVITSKLHQKLDEEFSLNVETLNVPYCRQDTRLPSKKDDLRLRLAVILSATTKLFLRAQAINSQMVFLNIEHIVQKSLKYY